MRQLLFAAVALTGLGLTGCTTARPIDMTSPAGRSELNARASHGSVVLALARGEVVEERAVHFGPDGASWVDSNTGDERSVSVGDVDTVRFPRPRRGALIGLAVGSAVGVGLGVPTLFDDTRPLGTLDAGTALLVTTLSGAVFGTAVGWARGRVGKVFVHRARDRTSSATRAPIN